jgi:hypothetical protein
MQGLSLFSLQFFYFVDEIGRFLKAAIDAREANVGDFVNLPQTVHDKFADKIRRDFSVVFIRRSRGNPIHKFFHDLGTDGTFLAGFFDAGQKFFFGKFFVPTVVFQDHQAFVFDFLISGEAMAAFEAFAASANRGAFPGSARINDFIVVSFAFRTSHSVATANGVVGYA